MSNYLIDNDFPIQVRPELKYQSNFEASHIF